MDGLVDGEPVGAINRVPQAGETRSNMHAGGRPEKVGLTERDLEICRTIGPVLREKGQVFVGIDVIGDWLTEINVTSPTGIQELERFDGINAAALIWDAIERKLAADRCHECTELDACKVWLDITAIRGAVHPPKFCRNADLFEDLANDAASSTF